MDNAASSTVAGGGSSPFSYDPLSGPGKLTRLATLHPGIPNENGETPGLCLSLRQVDLDQHPRYSAVSYVWGNPITNLAISVNGKTFYINSNLHDALVHIRANFVDSQEPLDLWIDALCINQADPAEQSRQITMMGDIYRQAERTILWLGPGDDGSREAMDVIRALGSDAADGVRGEDFATWDAFPVLKSLEAWQEVHQLFRRPFWYRLWIVQEVALSRNGTILCGDERISWLVFERAYRKWYKEFRLQPLKAPGYFGGFEALAVTRNGWGNLGSVMTLREAHRDEGDDLPHIFDKVAGMWQFEAAKPVDRIYGLLSITDHAIVPDCALSTEEVYTAFARSQIEEGRTEMMLFAGSGVLEEEHKTCALPSWVPDWHGRAAGKLRPNYRAFQHFLGAGRRPSAIRGTTKISISLVSNVADALSVQAILGPQVVRTTPPGFLGTDNFWDEFRSRAFEATYAGTGMSELQALFRTLLFDTSYPFSDYLRLSGLGARYYELVAGFLAVMARGLEIPGQDDDAASTLDHRPVARELFSMPESQFTDDDVDAALLRLFQGPADSMVDGAIWPVDRGVSERDLIAGFEERHAGHTRHQCFFWTAEGYFGLGPPGCREGDVPSALVGGEFLHILRQRDGYYEHVGPCFVLGLMDGELLQRVDDGEAEVREVIIR